MQYIEDLGSRVRFSSVAHPQSNGQAERANAEVLRGLRGCAKAGGAGLVSCRRFFGRSERCQIEPPARHPFPWSTGQKQFSPRNSYTGHLECSLMMSLRKSSCAKMTRRSEDRLRAAVRGARYQQALRRYHSRKAHARSLEEGDLVLRRVQSAKNSNKLTPKWEGPYRVIRVTRPGVVRLENEDAVPVSNSWNIEHKFYP